MISEHNWRARLGTAAIAAVVLGTLWQSVPSAASSATTTLQYTCAAGLPVTAQLIWNPPPEIVVGKTVSAITVTVLATIDAADARLLGAVGVTGIDGSGDAAGVVVAPEGTVGAGLHLVVSPTRVPASGPMTFHATGTLTGLLFRQPGHAVVDVGTALDLRMTARDADGNPIDGTAAVSCTLNSDQGREVLAFDITPDTPGATTGAAAVLGKASPGANATDIGGSSTASPVASSTPASTKASNRSVRDSAAISTSRRPTADWLLVAAIVASSQARPGVSDGGGTGRSRPAKRSMAQICE